MQRLVVIARLKAGQGPRAAELIAAGPPFDLAETGIVRHSVHLSAWEVVFVFDGHDVQWIVEDLIHKPFQYELHSAFDAWRSVVDGSPRYAHELFSWEAQAAAPPATSEALTGSAR
jgi:hypothetical protein